jgi:hypothetical protein
MTSRADLIGDLEGAFSGLQASLDGLSRDQMLREWYDGWTVRDILGHIIGWHEATTDIFARMAQGERPVPEGVDYSDSDAWNARFAKIWQGRSPEDAVAELAASKQRMVGAAKEVPEERFEEGRTARRALVGNGAHHYREHAAAIREWREREGI